MTVRTIRTVRTERTLRYFDASALASRYIRAAGTGEVNRWLREARAATCRLTEAD